MQRNFSERLKREISTNNSGIIYATKNIPILKEKHYCLDTSFYLDGDAPKGFIKAYFYERGGRVVKDKFKTWDSYIAKTAEKWYPHESILEYMLNRIGEVIELNMNSVKLVVINNQIRFLSKYFLDNKNEALVHGAEICGEYLEDVQFAKEIAEDRQTARELFTFEFILEAIKFVFAENFKEIYDQLVKMIVFDAIVGNNDRHFYNWGIIKTIKLSKAIKTRPKFSPIYDTARGLLWNWSDNSIKKQLLELKSGSKKVEKYIKNASPRISIEGNSEINHFDLISYIWNKYPDFKGTISNILALKNLHKIQLLYQSEFKHYFIPERNELACFILNARFSKLRGIINDN